MNKVTSIFSSVLFAMSFGNAAFAEYPDGVEIPQNLRCAVFGTIEETATGQKSTFGRRVQSNAICSDVPVMQSQVINGTQYFFKADITPRIGEFGFFNIPVHECTMTVAKGTPENVVFENKADATFITSSPFGGRQYFACDTGNSSTRPLFANSDFTFSFTVFVRERR
ncbi:hypothetical protein [Marinibactrum halimedae]|uniref:Uncharacterized protein n=1 Tax=Marinibactrum halimedae TaxID=1444977 RepID=A0AA37T6T9_9GAMM|nr:hypothetical protein [Marinibactrum halimedae]MCD9460638.1 hypothetical protein [Marinibactrum halimedae]GLS27854.1 hypothetical protein GCM10007877_35730 [Marinibactrum halimedae]